MIIVVITSIVLLILMFLGMPIAFSFLLASILYFLLSGENFSTIVPTAFYSLNNFALLALPLFIIAGNLMEASGIATKLVDFSEAMIKKVKGGLGSLIPLASMFFGALCGSGTATVATLGVILLPKLTKRGWDKKYTAALIASSGPLGYMIPPNINAILYAYVADASVAALFLATIIPGIIWGLLYMIINRVIYRSYYSEIVENTEVGEKKSNHSYFKNLKIASKGVIPAFIMPVIIFGGIYGGVFTPTEAGAISCIYAIIVGFFIYKKLNIKNTYNSFKNTAFLLGSFMVVLPMVMIFTRILIINGVPQSIAIGMTSLSSNKNVILLFMDIVYFIAGFFLDAGILVMIITPLMIPVAKLIGLNIIQMGVILMVAIGIGTITPPMAMSLYVISDISGVGVHEMIKPLIPFLLYAAIPVLLLVTYIPALSLWLPKIIMGIPY